MSSAPREGVHASPDLTLVTLRRSAELVIGAVGRLDGRTVSLLVACVRSWAGEGARDVTLDLAQVDGADGHAVGGLLHCRRILRARAGSLAIVNAPDFMQPTLDRAGLLASTSQVPTPLG